MSNQPTKKSATTPIATIFTAGGFNTNDMFDSFPTSGFNTVVLWSMGVEPSGDITIRNFGDQNVVAGGGTYNPQQNPEIDQFRSKVAAQKGSGSSVNRVELSFGIGSYVSHGHLITDQTFPNIMAIYQSQSHSPSPQSKNLIANIQVLQQVLNLDAVSFDDEVSYDLPSSLWLAQQCGALGMTVSICPFGYDTTYWQSLIEAANSNPSQPLIDAIYLQAWNADVNESWTLGGIVPQAGIWVNENVPPNSPQTPDQAIQQFETWKPLQQWAGGWYYNAGDIYANNAYPFQQYAQAVQSGLGE